MARAHPPQHTLLVSPGPCSGNCPWLPGSLIQPQGPRAGTRDLRMAVLMKNLALPSPWPESQLTLLATCPPRPPTSFFLKEFVFYLGFTLLHPAYPARLQILISLP